MKGPDWLPRGASRRERRDAGRDRRRSLPWSAIVASDSVSPGAVTSGLLVQLAGPSVRIVAVRDERSELAVLDLDGLDDAIEGPWEWDVRFQADRLARAAKNPDRARELVLTFARAYRETLGAAAQLDHAGGWSGLAAGPGAHKAYARLTRGESKGRRARATFPMSRRDRALEQWTKGRARIVRTSLPFDPLEVEADSVLRMFAEYREALPEALALRMQRSVVADAVGGAGNGGVLILVANEDGDDRLLLQTTPVRESIWESLAGDVVLGSDAQRVLLATQILQVSPDPVLGWSSDARQIGSVIWSQARIPSPEGLSAPQWLRRREAEALGQVLGRAHARTIDAPALAGYLGRSDGFDRILAESTNR